MRVHAEVKDDSNGKPYLTIIQRIPMGRLPKQTFKLAYDLRIDEINSNMLCDGQLPFCLEIKSAEDWHILDREMNETLSMIYEITQCLINIQIPELEDLPASAPIYHGIYVNYLYHRAQGYGETIYEGLAPNP